MNNFTSKCQVRRATNLKGFCTDGAICSLKLFVIIQQQNQKKDMSTLDDSLRYTALRPLFHISLIRGLFFLEQDILQSSDVLSTFYLQHRTACYAQLLFSALFVASSNHSLLLKWGLKTLSKIEKPTL